MNTGEGQGPMNGEKMPKKLQANQGFIIGISI